MKKRKRTLELLSEHIIPRFNTHVIGKTLAQRASENLVEAMDLRFRSANIGFPEGIRYVGIRVVSPTEELAVMAKPRNGVSSIDVSECDLRMLEITLTMLGEEVNFNIPIPYVGPSGIWKSSGVGYKIATVFTDGVIAESTHGVFVRLGIDKFRISQTPYDVRRDGIVMPFPMAFTGIHRQRSGGNAQSKILTACAHYLFAKYGLTDTFNRFAGCEAVYGKDLSHLDPKDWIIMSSSGQVPKTQLGDYRCTTDIKIAFQRSAEGETPYQLATAAIYLLDHLPIAVGNELNDLDSPANWQLLIGRAILTPAWSTSMMVSTIAARMYEFETRYVTELDLRTIRADHGAAVADRFRVAGFYSLLGYVLENYTAMTVGAAKTAGSLVGKRMEIEYYLLYLYTVGINMLSFQLDQLMKNKNRVPKIRDLREAWSGTMMRGIFFNIAGAANEIFVPTSHSNDQELYHFRLFMKPQLPIVGAIGNSSLRKAGGGDMQAMNPSYPMVNSMLSIRTSDPNASRTMNPFVEVDRDLKVVISDDYRDTYTAIEQMLAHKGCDPEPVPEDTDGEWEKFDI